MLGIKNISAGYGKVEVLHDFSLDVSTGEIVCLLGRNGAGKTTLMKSVMGLLKVSAGEILLNGRNMTGLAPHQVPMLGIGYIPQGRRLFSEMTVEENLQVGLMARGSGDEVRGQVLDMFPRLRERLDQRAETLSGGEQQMLATARALCLRPQVLLLDEPTEGLQPSMIALIRDAVSTLKDQGVAILLVEQRVDAVLQIADRVVFVENGRNALEATPEQLQADETLIHRYVGV